MLKLQIPLLVLILLLGFVVRLYRFDGPIADWHEWRQADTSAVSRNFVNSGFDVLHPRFDDLSNVPSKLDNPQGYRFVEFPIYNVLQAGLFKAIGIFTLEEWGRLVTIVSSLTGALFIYFIIKRRANPQAALIASFLFTFMPYDIYYGRVILPDPMMVASILGGVYFFDLFINSKKNNWKYFVLSLVLTATSLLLKPYALFFTLPMFYIAFEKMGIQMFKKWYLWVFLIVSILPLLLWRIWMLQYPEGIPTSDWLFNENNIRFKASFFYWIFAERVGHLILGYWGIPLLILGFLAKIKKNNYLFFFSFIASSLIYVTVLASGNVQHDYYQILIVPSLVIFAGLGGDFLLSMDRAKAIKYPLFAILVIFCVLFRWYAIRDYFNINNRAIVEDGVVIDEITPKNAKIIAEYGGDTAFLYQTKRKGWASFEKSIPEMIKLGADYLALVDPKPADSFFKKDYKVVYSSDKLLLYDLHQKP